VARQTPNLEENQGFRAFQLSPQEAPSVWSDASEPSSGRWKYGREMAEKFCRKWRLPRHFWVLLHALTKHDMRQTALLPLRRKACWGFFRPKNPTASAGFETANSGTKGQHATSRPLKPLVKVATNTFVYIHGMEKIKIELSRTISSSYIQIKVRTTGYFKKYSFAKVSFLGVISCMISKNLEGTIWLSIWFSVVITIFVFRDAWMWSTLSLIGVNTLWVVLKYW
jgi:hypothetical protein